MSVIGSIVGTRQALAEVFHRTRQAGPRSSPRPGRSPFVNECMDEVLCGQVKARIVFDLGWGR
jgi:propanol-preferring alcohol dehydrogenase